MVQGKTSPNKGLFAGLIGIGVLAIVIGCGGGGGGLTGTTTGTGGSTAATTGTTTATTGTTTATTTTGSTAGTTTGGTTGGQLPPNVLIFNFVDPNDATGQTVDVDYISSDTVTTPQTSYATYVNNNTTGAIYSFVAPNPAPGTVQGVKSTFAFVYQDPTTTLSDIWVGPTVSVTTGKKVTSSGFTSFGSLQYSPDGTHFVFTATSGSGNSQVWVCNSDGTQLRFIDSADDAYLADDNVSIAYTKEDATPNGQIWTVHIDGTNVKQITSDAFDHFNPQWSKDASRLTWSASPSGNGFDVYTSLPDGTQLNQVTNLQGDAGLSPSFNGDGTQVGFVDVSTNISASGVYYATINGLGLTQVVAQSTIQAGLFWTSGTGLLNTHGAHSNTPVFGHGYHIARLKKLGRWHWK